MPTVDIIMVKVKTMNLTQKGMRALRDWIQCNNGVGGSTKRKTEMWRL